jgi:hypothetical protein
LAKIVQQREVKARVVQVEAEGILPIHAAPDGIGRLPVSQPLNILHDYHEHQAPRGYFHGAALGWIQIGKELILIERAEFRAEVDIEIPFGKGGPHSRRRGLWNGWERLRVPGHISPPRLITVISPSTRRKHHEKWSIARLD